MFQPLAIVFLRTTVKELSVFSTLLSPHLSSSVFTSLVASGRAHSAGARTASGQQVELLEKRKRRRLPLVPCGSTWEEVPLVTDRANVNTNTMQLCTFRVARVLSDTLVLIIISNVYFCVNVFFFFVKDVDFCVNMSE